MTSFWTRAAEAAAQRHAELQEEEVSSESKADPQNGGPAWQAPDRCPTAPPMSGRFFDEWQVGDRVAHTVTRTVTETDNVLISTLTHNPQPMHLDHEAAAASEFGKPLVNSIFTFGLMIGVSVADTTLGTLVANLGYDQLKFPNPVFAGDTLRSETECIALRDSKSRPNAGIVTWAHRSFNQRGELVCECTRTALLLKRPQ